MDEFGIRDAPSAPNGADCRKPVCRWGIWGAGAAMNEFCARHRPCGKAWLFRFAEQGVLQVCVDGLFAEPDAQQGAIEIFTGNILSAGLVADGWPGAAAGQPFQPDLVPLGSI